jgi:hypothetical protein
MPTLLGMHIPLPLPEQHHAISDSRRHRDDGYFLCDIPMLEARDKISCFAHAPLGHSLPLPRQKSAW